MGLNIRKATAEDANGWQDLLKEAFGTDEIAQQVYDLARVGRQLTGPEVEETWIAEVNGRLRGSISLLSTGSPSNNPVANLGRYVVVPQSYSEGSAEALVRGINEVCLQRKQTAVMRVPASDHDQQDLLEKLGYVCTGFQPWKHLCMVREGILFYVCPGDPLWVTRPPLSRSLPHVCALANEVLRNLQVPLPEIARDGLTGYPLQTELSMEETTAESYESCKLLAQPSNPPAEISGQFNRGLGLLRVGADLPLHALLGRRDGDVVAGILYYFDDHDKFVRIVDAFATDDLSTGAMLREVTRRAAEQFSAVYVEVDILVTAPRALKTAEQLGFAPVAYFPGFYNSGGYCVDLVKMVKLNTIVALEKPQLTPQAAAMVAAVDGGFDDQKIGVAVIHLLRGLPAFEGLGDGELAKLARLFTQKLYRAHEKIFDKGDSSNEAYVVMRGQIEVYLEEGSRPVATLGAGTVIGEQAFLDGTPRNAAAVATHPTILLVVQRAAFQRLLQTEPQLGLVVLRNLAQDLSHKLRVASVSLAQNAR